RLKEGKLHNISFAVKTKKGEVMDVLLSVVIERDEEQRFVGTTAFLTEITELKKTEAALKTLERAIEESIDGIAMVGKDGYLMFANRAWFKMHGHRPVNSLVKVQQRPELKMCIKDF